MKFFLPDWDDRIDPGYDFETDRETYGRDPYRNDVYAHEYFGDMSPYDGILVSRSSLGESGPKRDRVDRVGFRRFFRLPPHMQIMGDCGAFGYIREPVPRYTTSAIIDYYTRHGVDYGISVDHLVVPEFPEQRQQRYEITLTNAVEFLRIHRNLGCPFVPVGAIQGWDVDSYVAAARRLASVGYEMIAIGGLARSRTQQVREIVASVLQAVPTTVGVHVLGIAREQLFEEFHRLGVHSFDSASPMRSAWLSATRNYYGRTRDYLAIRVPYATPVRGEGLENLLSRSQDMPAMPILEEYERSAMRALRLYGRRDISVDRTLEAVSVYDQFLTRKGTDFKRDERLRAYRRTLIDRPWDRCRCAVCRSIGIDVVIFRGSNRNRRRGFHNTFTFNDRLRRHRII